MTRKQVEQYLAAWQARLGLERWDIVVDWDKPCAATAEATITREHKYERAWLRLRRDWDKWGNERIKRVIIHELLHLATRDIDRVLASAQKSLHPDAWRMLNDRYDHEIEGFIDALAVRLVALV